MQDHHAAYELLAERLTAQGIDVERVKEAIKNHHIETPSWGYANSGTRFKAFPWPGAAVTTRQKLDDAAMVHKMTGIAPTVAIHIPWDKPEDGDYDAMRQYAEEQGIRIGAVNPNVFQDDEYRLGSFGNPDPAVREQALDHVLECCEIMTKVHSDILSLWFADGTNYAGQDSLRERKRRFEQALETVYQHLPAGGRMLIEYKFFEPAFYSTDIPDWGTAYAWSLKLGDQAQVLVDLGHHAQGVNIEQIVAFLLDEGKLGGFHFNNRKYADDDLIVGSVNPYELFLIYNELVDAEQSSEPHLRETARNVAYMIDQSHNVEGKMAPMILSVLNCQEAYAKAQLVPRQQLAEARAAGDVLAAHHLLTEAYRTDVRPLLAQVREEMGVPVDPLAAYWASGYEEKIRKERGITATSGGYQ
ncbi:L-rhamnose isomerase [Litorilinea aerophila]|uniref:L-rhamnose isomerase n=1 Tax=Litorilinea aerophila TaxID=1204385 RepID=A0A540VMP6_9CHLR|nr:L-rhamnose isomerase [Litorilinea aerophila]MCC9074731.1 L-rhamnose isomerase [Litorilinea aerophila]GIV75909.1 MAG: L-rhamnose isomerase [Litorilinea sp.]